MENSPQDRAARRQGVIGLGLVAFAVLVQVQITPLIGVTPVRINAADAALGLLSPLILVGLFRRGGELRMLAGSKLLAAVAAATLALTISLAIGYRANGVVTNWAAIKYAGWFILLGYMAVGMLIAMTVSRENIMRFIVAFVAFQVGAIFLFMFAELSGWKTLIDSGPRFTGYVGNPNAMGVYLLCGVALVIAHLDRLGKRRGRIVLVTASVLIAGILYTNSVSTLIALVCMLVLAWVLHVSHARKILLICLLAVGVWLTPQFLARGAAIGLNVIEKLFDLTRSQDTADSQAVQIQYVSIGLRIEGYEEAYAMWRANPVLGGGLGTQLRQKEMTASDKSRVQQIHSTALWLLAETGLAGFSAFAVLFILIFRQVWRLARPPGITPEGASVIATAAILFIAGWLVMSVFHELMYQRVVWLLAGMALAGSLAGKGTTERET